MNSVPSRRQIICKVCSRQRNAIFRYHDVCISCLKTLPRTQCHRCKNIRYFVDDTTGLCPRCTVSVARPVRKCSRCSHNRIIYNLEENLCSNCNSYVHKPRRQKDMPLTECSVCGRMRPSHLRSKAICRSCWNRKYMERGICSRCNKLRILHVKKARICRICYPNECASRILKRYVGNFRTPYLYNKTLFDLLAQTINWQKVTEKRRREIFIFGRFLQTQEMPKLISWEVIESILPSLGLANRNTPKCIRAGILRIAYLLAKRGELESWESYKIRRGMLLMINQSPEPIRKFLYPYADWLRERKLVPRNISEHLRILSFFWCWCELRGIFAPEEIQPPVINDYLLSLCWQWQCSTCQGTMTFDPNNRIAPENCIHCYTTNSLMKQRREARYTVGSRRGILAIFFDWLKISRKIISNPVQCKAPIRTLAIKHYSPEVIKQFCIHIKNPDADPTEALILYLIIFHALSVWELQHAILPTILPLHEGISIPSLAEAYYIIVPRRAPSRGDQSPGRPDTSLGFPSSATSWLKPLLLRFEQQRKIISEGVRSPYLLLTTKAVHRHTTIGNVFIWDTIRRISRRLFNANCNANTLRKTAGVMFADSGGAGILRWMGWNQEQAFAYSYVAREMIIPRPLDAPEGEIQQKSIGPIIFPAPEES